MGNAQEGEFSMSARMRAMKRAKYASGGKITGVPVPGEAVIKEAESDSDGFKKGGMIAKGRKFARGGFAQPPRKAFGGPPGGMPGGMPPQAFGGARPPMPPPAVGAPPASIVAGPPAQANPAAMGALAARPDLPSQAMGVRPFKKGGAAKPTRLASGGSPYSAASKGGKDAPDKGGECS
jgi:hypothetical protein